MDLELGTEFQEEKDDLKPLTYRQHKTLEMNLPGRMCRRGRESDIEASHEVINKVWREETRS